MYFFLSVEVHAQAGTVDSTSHLTMTEVWSCGTPMISGALPVGALTHILVLLLSGCCGVSTWFPDFFSQAAIIFCSVVRSVLPVPKKSQIESVIPLASLGGLVLAS